MFYYLNTISAIAHFHLCFISILNYEIVSLALLEFYLQVFLNPALLTFPREWKQSDLIGNHSSADILSHDAEPPLFLAIQKVYNIQIGDIDSV